MSRWTWSTRLSARHRYISISKGPADNDIGHRPDPTRLPPTPTNRRRITHDQTLAWLQRDMSAYVRLRRPWHLCNRHKPGFHLPASQPWVRVLRTVVGRTTESSSSSNGGPITHRRRSSCSPRPLRQRTPGPCTPGQVPVQNTSPRDMADRSLSASHTSSILPQPKPRGSGAGPHPLSR